MPYLLQSTAVTGPGASLRLLVCALMLAVMGWLMAVPGWTAVQAAAGPVVQQSADLQSDLVTVLVEELAEEEQGVEELTPDAPACELDKDINTSAGLALFQPGCIADAMVDVHAPRWGHRSRPLRPPATV